MRAIITFLTAALLAGPALARVTQDGPIQVVVVGQDETEVTARRLELAERYAELMELERVITEMTQAIGQGYLDSLVELGGGQEPPEMADMREAMNDAYADVAPVLIERMVSVYARVYTEVELAALVEFYESPVGLSLIAKSREVDRLVALETEDLLPLFEEHFRSRYCARAECPKLTPTN